MTDFHIWRQIKQGRQKCDESCGQEESIQGYQPCFFFPQLSLVEQEFYFQLMQNFAVFWGAHM